MEALHRVGHLHHIALILLGARRIRSASCIRRQKRQRQEHHRIPSSQASGGNGHKDHEKGKGPKKNPYPYPPASQLRLDPGTFGPGILGGGKADVVAA